jgi:hypothetical protein
MKHEIDNSIRAWFNLQLHAPFTESGRGSFDYIPSRPEFDLISPMVIDF